MQFHRAHLQNIAYKTIEFLFSYIVVFDFLTKLFLFRANVSSAENEYIHNYDTENE